jgi:hypothetical protein
MTVKINQQHINLLLENNIQNNLKTIHKIYQIYQIIDFIDFIDFILSS